MRSILDERASEHTNDIENNCGRKKQLIRDEKKKDIYLRTIEYAVPRDPTSAILAMTGFPTATTFKGLVTR